MVLKIDALTTCVGERYTKYLAKSLPIWLDTCDSVTVVTDQDTDFSCIKNYWIWRTDLFTAHGASFNKGAALSYGFAQIENPEWILNFDADIIPPKDWRKIAESRIRPGRLYGCSHRYGEDNTQIPDADFPNIWGFFHLWHVDDPRSWSRPVYPVDCGHAGNYDHSFMRRWPEEHRVDLWPEIKLVHQGEPRERWFGNDPKNDKKMANLFLYNLHDAWRDRVGHIKVPSPEASIRTRVNSVEEARELLRDFTDPDPFKYQLEIIT